MVKSITRVYSAMILANQVQHLKGNRVLDDDYAFDTEGGRMKTSSSRDRGADTRLLNIDANNPEATTIFNVYRERAESRRVTQSLSQSDQSKRSKYARKQGKNT